MGPRLDYVKAAPDAYKALSALSAYVDQCGLAPRLLHLIRLRASQVNGCAYCVDMHVREALHDGENQQRLHLIVSWRESPLYTDEERAVLAWTEALTLLPESQAPAEDFERLRAFFSDGDIMRLSTAIAMINAWNRIAVGFRSQHPIDKITAA